MKGRSTEIRKPESYSCSIMAVIHVAMMLHQLEDHKDSIFIL